MMNKAEKLSLLPIIESYPKAVRSCISCDKKGSEVIFIFDDKSKLVVAYSGISIKVTEDLFDDMVIVRGFD